MDQANTLPPFAETSRTTTFALRILGDGILLRLYSSRPRKAKAMSHSRLPGREGALHLGGGDVLGGIMLLGPSHEMMR